MGKNVDSINTNLLILEIRSPLLQVENNNCRNKTEILFGVPGSKQVALFPQEVTETEKHKFFSDIDKLMDNGEKKKPKGTYSAKHHPLYFQL